MTPNSTYFTGVIHQWNWSNLSFSTCTEVESDVVSHNNFTWSLCCHVYKHFLSGKLHLSYVACNFSKTMMVCYLGKIKSETFKGMWAVKRHIWCDELNADLKSRSKLFWINSNLPFEVLVHSLSYIYAQTFHFFHLLRKFSISQIYSSSFTLLHLLFNHHLHSFIKSFFI